MSTSKLWAALALAALLSTMALDAQQAAPPAQTVNLQETVPFDAAVRTGTLPNGLRFFIRQNPRPAMRLSLRLAVKAGSLFETEDQQGLAHFLEHMAFNGSAHFKPGELVSYFERTGARLGPHVNAYTSFDETVYMLELPTDAAEIVSNGLNALADFAGGLTLDAEQVDKERGVVIEEWRGRLGAGSRIGDKQLPFTTSPAMPSACPLVSPKPSGARPPRDSAPFTTPGIGPIRWRSWRSATSIQH
jgi:predicted Zn-dependent peptidase